MAHDQRAAFGRVSLAAFAVLLALALLVPAGARAGTYGDRLLTEGNEFFRAGNFFRASESYRCAVLEESADGMKKLLFGHSLFALGNYAYASYSFRRGVRYLGYPDDLKIDLASLFPSRFAYERAMDDVRRYAGYYPDDPQALTVIAYAAYFGGERTEAEGACRRLLALDPHDAFAAYVLRRIEGESGPGPYAPPEIDASAAEPVPATLARTPVRRVAAAKPASVDGAAPSTTALRPPRREPAPARQEVPAAPAKPIAAPQGESSGPAHTLSHDEPEPAIAR